ncbi:HAD family hydrolase [Butyrivibrio sp. NC3005]|uniref:HAD family hydrolase n=1 Tax=Butyrivibrio sp. NC3005 TaxID=1280685 RepID=UPI000410CF89|nr:HAD family hydrolase [Butyrivibrio sp. NC3005]
MKVLSKIIREKRCSIFKASIILILSLLLYINSYENAFVVSADDMAPLSLWTDSARAKNELISYVSDVTNPESKNYIPLQDRIAVFDLDGTLFCETDPVYFDHQLLEYRVLEDSSYKDKASDAEKAAANKSLEFANTGVYPQGLDVEHGQAVASAFRGMTIDEFTDYIAKFRDTPANGYNNMTKGDAFYQPMIQVINYLHQNGFMVYIVSGTDRFIVRGLVKGKLPILPCRIIGSDESLVSNHQENTDSLDYMYKKNDMVVLGGNFIIKNLKMNKVNVIVQEIGQQPVLAFGNSSGDFSMAEYVTSHNAHKSLAFMLCCDDTERENGKISSAEKMYQSCKENNWIPISMKNDWTTIYGEGVSKK